jgi:signal transduction histidine kinase
VAAVHGLPGEWLSRPAQEIAFCALDCEALAGKGCRGERCSKIGAAPLSQGWRAELCVPLIHEGQPFGTLHVYSIQSTHFGEHDVTRLRPLADLGAAAIALARRVAELEVMEARKAEFVRVATHELRSPVTVAQSLVRSVLKRYTGELNDQQVEVLTRISRRLDFLEGLVNDLLDLAAGKAPELAEERPVSLNASIRRVMLLWQPRAEEKNQAMTLDLCRDQLVVRGAEEGLDRILVNLVGNAVKYTPPGGSIMVSVHRLDGQAQIVVSDTGIGIPEESLPHLFEEFYRAPNAKKMAEVGTGLGLSIVQDLVVRYGGRIHVQRVLGKGTTFTVTFPLLSADAT